MHWRLPAALVAALVAAAALTNASPSQAALTAPAHGLEVFGAGVAMYPDFVAGTERFAVTTTAETAGMVTVAATTSDPTGVVLINGRPEADGRATVTGLTEGDEVSVIFIDSAGTEVHSLVYLPAEFPTLRVVTKEGGIAPGFVGLTLTGWNPKPSPAFETAVDVNGVPVYVNDRVQSSVDLKRLANGHFSVSRRTTSPGRTGYKLVELDERFHKVGEFETVGMVDTDGHDSILRPDGSRIQIAYEPNSDTGLTDAIIQEVGPRGRVRFAWNSGNVPAEDLPAETLAEPGNGDYAHLNSIWETADGNLLASFRHLSSVLKIDWRTDDGDGRGAIIWKLGGRDSDFTFVDDPYPTGPCAQHTASELPNGHILLFDNGSASMFRSLCLDPSDLWGPAVDRISTRVTEYALDLATGTATLVRDFAPPDRFGFFAGSASRLPNGNTLLGWAASSQAVATEVNSVGEVVWELNVPPVSPDDPSIFYSTYRAAKFDVPDMVDPVVRITAPAQGVTYLQGSLVPARYRCTDRGGSSLHGCDASVVAGAALDTSTAGTHRVTVSAVDGSGNTKTVTHRYRVAPAAHAPDAAIRRLGGSTWIGADVYGAASGQTATARLSASGGSVTAEVRLQNDGTEAERLLVTASRRNADFRVAYRAAGSDITADLLAGTFRTPRLAPGASLRLRMVVTSAARAAMGDVRTLRVHVASTVNPTAIDAVALRVTATR